MDENLNAALNSLDMLSTVTSARREYLAERRYQNSCSLTCFPPWRNENDTDGAGNLMQAPCPTVPFYFILGTTSSSGFPTKENQGLEKTFLYCASRRQSEKFYNRRPRSRCLPYDIRRKPFNGFNNSSSSSSGSSSGITSPTRGGLNSTNFSIPTMTPHSLISTAVHHLDELKTTKTDKFPVPVLFRSKSLESINDLRDRSRKEKEDLDVASNNSHSSQGLQIQSGSNCIDFGIGIHNRGGIINLCTNNINIKKEIDSMSMRIEKLDVA